MDAFKARMASRARSSSGHAVCSRIGSIFLVWPRFQLQVRMGMTGWLDVGKVPTGADQYVLQPGMYFLERLWFHVLSQSDALQGPSTCAQWHDWHPEYELHPGR